MATNDDRFIPDVKPSPSEAAPPSLASLNENLRRIWEQLYYLEGRVGTVSIRDETTFLAPSDSAESITLSTDTPDDASQFTDRGVVFEPRQRTPASEAWTAAGATPAGNNLTSGLVTEVGGALMSFGINAPQIGNRDTAYVGGLCRIDTRNDNPSAAGGNRSFVLYGYPVGSVEASPRFTVSLDDGTTWLGPAGGSVVLQGAALATTATSGFTYLPTCAGTPTGVPVAQTGTVATVYDSTNNRLYIYNGAWRSVLLS